MKIRNKAFTLAETLVVMGIIGVIAALTIPNLSQSTGNREKVTKIKKSFSELNEALDRAQAIYGPFTSWPFNYSDGESMSALICGRVTEFMKVSKACTPDSSVGQIYSFTPADGYPITIVGWADTTYPAVTWLVNTKGKGGSGKSSFRFFTRPMNTSDYGVVSANLGGNDMTTLLANVTKCLKSELQEADESCSTAAAGWVIKYDNMDYLKLNATTSKCPNGTTPTEQNPRCN